VHVLNNDRFLILEGVRVKNLASHVLGRNVRMVSEDWHRRYGLRPYVLETFIDPRFSGACYRAAGWERVGETKGYAKLHTGYRYHGQRKEVYVYVVEPEFRTIIGCKRRSYPRRRSRSEEREGKLRMMIQKIDYDPNLIDWAEIGEDMEVRLAEELVQWASRQGIATATARCYAAEGELAYAPVAAWLRARPHPPLEPVWRSEIARLLPELLTEDPDLPQPGPITEPWQRRRFFEALSRALIQREQPQLLLSDALQWCDRGSIEWLHHLLRYDPGARLLVVGAYRPDEVGEDHPLPSLMHALRQDDQLTEIELDPLDKGATETLAENVAGRELPPSLINCLYRETEGNPLFIVETVRGGLPDEVRELPSGHVVCVPRPLPSRMKDALVARISQLSPLSRSLAELAATIGREFTFDVLQESSDAGEDRLVRGLDELWQRRIIREQGEDAYDFSHDKLREVLVTDLSEARRHLLHRRVARALERVYADDLDSVAARIAAHYEQADEPQEAIAYYQRAAKTAREMHAQDEAARYSRRISALERALSPES
jgi:hypothetical protein